MKNLICYVLFMFFLIVSCGKSKDIFRNPETFPEGQQLKTVIKKLRPNGFGFIATTETYGDGDERFDGYIELESEYVADSLQNLIISSEVPLLLEGGVNHFELIKDHRPPEKLRNKKEGLYYLEEAQIFQLTPIAIAVNWRQSGIRYIVGFDQNKDFIPDFEGEVRNLEELKRIWKEISSRVPQVMDVIVRGNGTIARISKDNYRMYSSLR